MDIETRILKTEKNLLTESEGIGTNESVMKTRLENDVLRMRIKTIEGNIEGLNCIKNEELYALKATNEEKNIKIGDQEDKIRQLDTSNTRKDVQIEGLKKLLDEKEKRLNELSEQKNELKRKISEMKATHAESIKARSSQAEKIQKLELELEAVKRELRLIWEQKEKQELIFLTYINDQTRQKEELQRMVKETVKETMKETMKELLSTMGQRKEAYDAPRGPEFHIKEVHSVQIAVESENGSNVVEQASKAISNRRELKPPKLHMQPPKSPKLHKIH